MSIRETLLDQIRNRRSAFEQTEEKKIIEPDLFPGLLSNSLMVNFVQFFNNDLCSDFKLILNRNDPTEVNKEDDYGNRKLNVIHAHKFVLSQSEWFRVIFESNMVEQLTNELIVNESEENLDAFTAMISMMYGNYVPSFEKLDSTLIGELLICFDKYQANQLFDKVSSGLIQNCLLETSKYRPYNILWLYSMFGHRIKSVLLSSSLSIYLSIIWSKSSKKIRKNVQEERQKEFSEFFNKQDFNSCYFFLEEFVIQTYSFELVSKSIDEWIKYDESDRFDKGYLLYRVALQKKLVQ